MTDEANPNMLEMVAKAIGFCHFMRVSRNPRPEYVERVVERRWREFEHDARMVLEIINGLVEREQLEEQISSLPQLPDFLKATVQ
jgi:hypothetical protein